MKQVLTCLVVVMMMIVGAVAFDANCNERLTRDRMNKVETNIEKIQTDIAKIDQAIDNANHTTYTMMDTEFRIMHYIEGHDFNHPVMSCPECGMVKELEKRKLEVSEEIVKLSEFIANNPNDPTVAEKTILVNELEIESNFVTRYIASSTNRAKQLGKIMYKRIYDANAKADAERESK